MSTTEPVRLAELLSARDPAQLAGFAARYDDATDAALLAVIEAAPDEAAVRRLAALRRAVSAADDGGPPISFPLGLDEHLPLATALDVLRASTWAQAFALALPAELDGTWAALEARAVDRGDDDAARRARRHGDAVTRARAVGPAQAADELAAAPDLREPKDRAAWLAVLSKLVGADRDELVALVGRYPDLLTDDAAALVRALAHSVLHESQPVLALRIEERRLLLDRIRRLGLAGVDRVPDAAPAARQGALCALADAAAAGFSAGGGLRDVDEAIGAWAEALFVPGHEPRSGARVLDELRIGDDLRTALVTRHQVTGSGFGFDLQLAVMLGVLDLDVLPDDAPRELEAALLRSTIAAMVEAVNASGDRSLVPTVQGHAERLLALYPDPTADRATALGTLLDVVVAHYEHSGDPLVLQRAEALHAELASLPVAGWPDRLGRRRAAATVLLYRARYAPPGRALPDALAAAVADLRGAPTEYAGAVVVHAAGLAAAVERVGVGDLGGARLVVELTQIAVDRSRPSETPAAALTNLAQALLRSHQLSGDGTELARAETVAEEALRAATRQGLDAPPFRNVRANVWQRRYLSTGDVADLDQAVALFESVAQEAAGDTALMAASNLGASLQMRYDATRAAADLDRAVAVMTDVVARSRDDDPFLLNRTSVLAGLLRMRAASHRAAGRVEDAAADAERGIGLLRTALGTVGPTHPAAAFAWINLALALQGRYALTRDRADVVEALDWIRRTLVGLPATSPHLPMVVQNHVAASATLLAHDHPVEGTDWRYALDQGELLSRLRTGEDAETVLDQTWERWTRLAGAPEEAVLPSPTGVPDADTDDLPASVRLYTTPGEPVRLDLPAPIDRLVRRVRDGADEQDPAADLAIWQTVFAHPMFPDVDPGMRRPLLLSGAAAAFLHHAAAPSLASLDAWLAILRALAELLEPDHPWWSAVTLDVVRVTATRYSYTADARDLDAAFDQLAASAEPRDPGDPQRLECLEYLGGLLGRYDGPVRGTTAFQRRVRRLDALLSAVPPAADGERWAPVRLAVIRGYAADVVDRDRHRENVQRSLEVAEQGLVALRRAGEDTESWAGLVAMVRERAAALAAEEVGEKVYDVGAAMALAGDRSDPDAARERVQVLRVAVQRVPPTDRAAWFGVRSALAVDLMRLLAGSRAANVDEAIAVAEEMAREATADDEEQFRTLPLLLLGDLYSMRVNGDPAENAELTVGHYRRYVEATEPGSRAWVRGSAQWAYALTRRVRGRRSANLEAALELCERALAAADALGRPDLRADVNYILGSVYRNRLVGDRSDNAERAIDAYAACLRERTLEANGDDWANAHHNLGGAYLSRVVGDRQENIARAIHHYEQELVFFDRTHWPDDWATAMIALGDAHSQSLRPSPAESQRLAVAAYEGALDVLTRTDHPTEWLRVHNSLGIVLLDADQLGDRPKDPQRALECFEEAERVAPPGLSERGLVLTNMVGALTLLARRRTDVEERRALMERALAASGEAVSLLDRTAEPALWARAQSGIAQCALELADLGVDTHVLAARDGLRDALDVFHENGLLAEEWSAAVGLVLLNRHAGQWGRAVEAYHRAAGAHEALYRTALLQDARAAVVARGRQLVEAALPALLAGGDLVGAVVAVERVRARWLGEALARDRIDLERLGREHPPLRAAYAGAAQALASAEALERRAAAAGEGDAVPVGAAEGTLAGAVEKARQGFAEVLARIRRVAGFRRFLALPDIDDIGAAVRPGVPLVYVVPTAETCHLLFVHRRAGGEVGVRSAEAPELTRGRVDALLLDPADGDVPYLVRQLLGSRDFGVALAALLDELGRLLVPPLRRGLDELGATGVTLVPGGRLALLPIAAAPHPETGVRLLDALDVGHLPSAWARERRADGEPGTSTLVAVGDPTADLPYARAEAEEVAGAFAPGAAVLHRGDAATVDAVVASLADADYVHLSCHGYYDVDSPLDSHLLLAGGGRLTLRALLGGRMFAGVRLVVASACQTAVGDFQSLPDEAIGLPAGFLRAGAAAVIGTLWPVGDLSTALLMMRFYQLHLGIGGEAGMPPVRALRTAQRWLSTVTAGELGRLFGGHDALRAAASPRLPADVAAVGAVRFGLDDPAARPFADPYHWAAFQLTGE